MSEQTAEAAATETEAATEQTETKPTETVDFWKQKAREQEKRAKENSSAATKLAEIEESQKSEAQKSADRLAAADAEIAKIPAKVSEALRVHLVALHKIPAEDAELFLTASDPEVLLKQVERLVARGVEDVAASKKHGNFVAREGTNSSSKSGSDDERAFVRELFATGD